ncbi:DUF5518 domain-containing protein [Halorussus halobius]|uniref:DUF5518 domain-containing protein n=1 Tax=Halorussus halobius TaxID=1710537 RepID=UPI001092BB53|nr:DUF5518 domain-containing protein [Halorussus halobius]
MEEERTVTRSRDRQIPDEQPNTLLNVVAGAAATVVTVPLLPFSAVFGGGVAGYLQQRDLATGAKVGALSGAVASIPAFFLVWLVVGVFLLGGDPFFALSSLFALTLFFLVAGYLVVAGALGGAIGAYLRAEL